MEELDQFFAWYADRYMADVDAGSAIYEAPFRALREGRAIGSGGVDLQSRRLSG